MGPQVEQYLTTHSRRAVETHTGCCDPSDQRQQLSSHLHLHHAVPCPFSPRQDACVVKTVATDDVSEPFHRLKHLQCWLRILVEGNEFGVKGREPTSDV